MWRSPEGREFSAQNAPAKNWSGRGSVVKSSVTLPQVFPPGFRRKTRVEKGLRRGIHVRTTRTQDDAEPAKNGLPDEGRAATERTETARSLAGGESLRADSGCTPG